MKKTLILVVLAILLVFQFGCVKATISGGPQIRVPGGILRGGLFPPQLFLGITNTTTMILRIKAISAVDRVHAQLIPGEEIDIPFRHFSSDCRGLMVTVSAYNPETGAYIASRTNRYSVCGGQNQVDHWDVRLSGDQRSYTIQ
jgi:hypothetical protein